MKKINIFIIMTIMLLAASSCRKVVPLEEQSPNAFPGASANLMIAGPQMATIQIAEGELARLAGIFDNQFTGSDRQYISYNDFVITHGDFDNIWSVLYVDGVKNCRIIEEKASKAGQKDYLGVAQIVEAYLIGNATAMWGDVPFSEAVDVEKYPNPKFDKQSDVYKGVQKLLDEGITNVGNTKVGNLATVYKSNGITWAEVAHSLKARFYLHTGDYAKALAEAKQGLTNKNDWQANHDVTGYTDGKMNLMFAFMVWHREGYMTADDAYLAKSLDPSSSSNRANAKTADTARFNYFYMNSSSCFYCSSYDPNYWKGGIFYRNQPFAMFSYVENELILAECELRANNDEATALTHLNNARNWWNTKLGVTEYTDYVAADFNTGGIADHGKGSSKENLLFEVLFEKYASLYGQVESWNDMRRTDNYLNIPLKKGNKVPERFLIPQSELNSNTNAPNDKGLFDPTEVNS
jgi:hypothetical protein